MALDRYMNALPPPDKLGLADYLESLAQSLRMSAQEQARKSDARDRARRHRARIKDAREVLRAYLRQGLDAARAVQVAEQQTGLEPETLHAWAMTDAPAIAREKRNRAIMQKVALGWTNAEIADHYGLAEKYVQRIISAERRQTQTTPTAPRPRSQPT
nr:hypothetical protein 20 [Moraxellaceae bacterium]